MFNRLLKPQSSGSNKLKLLSLIQSSSMPNQGKVVAAMFLKQLSEEQATSLIKDFYEMLNHREEIQAKINAEFPGVCSSVQRTNDDNRDDGERENLFRGEASTVE